MTHRITSLLLAAMMLLAAGTAGAAAPANTKPFVVPELRQWQGARGEFAPAPSMRIVAATPELRAVADSLAADWQRMFGTRPAVATGKAADGDIALAIKKVKAPRPDEAYAVTITPKGVKVEANEPVGAYWATRTLLQIAEQSAEHTLPAGRITDWPDYGVRGLSMDVGRKFFTIGYIRSLARIMAYYKLNSLRMHLNDNGFPYYFGNDWDKTYAAFRLESDTFPGLTARDGYYTKQEFRDLQAEGRGEFVEVVPEIDIPAHSLAFAHYKKGIGSEEFGQDHLNLFNPATQPFLDSLFAEYLGGPDPVFTGRYMHIGTDEFGKDYPGFDKQRETAEQFRGFMDHYIRLVESYGKTPWVWGSLSTAPGETPIKTQGVMLDAWYNGYADPKEMVKLGFKINSIPDGMVYIVPAAGYYYDYLNTDWLYNNWTPAKVGNVQFEEGDTALVGGYFAVWNDHVGNGISQQDVHHRIMAAMPTMAAKLWDGPSVTVPYADFMAAAARLSEGPGINLLGRHGQPNTLVYEAAEVKPGSTLPLDDIGYGYTVEFDLEAVPEESGTVLFSSPLATVYMADPVKGLLGFARDGYLYTFNYRPYPGEKTSLRITGTNKNTTLWVNGKKYESLDPVTQWFNEGKNKMFYQQTLQFPLRQAGRFKSRVKNLKVYNFVKHCDKCTGHTESK